MEEKKQGYRAGDEDVKADIITYNTVIKLVARSRVRGCFEEVQALVNEMEAEGLPVDSVTCNTVMGALVKSGELQAVKKAEDMFHDMERMYKEGSKGARPGEITFNILLHAYAKSDDPDDASKAERLLNRMSETLQQDNREGIGPTIQSFGTFANSGQAEAAEAPHQTSFVKRKENAYVIDARLFFES